MPQTITKHEHYAQRTMIAELFGFRLWTADCLPPLVQQAEHIVRRDVTPGFIAAELIIHLKEHKIVRPEYTSLQTLMVQMTGQQYRSTATIHTSRVTPD